MSSFTYRLESSRVVFGLDTLKTLPLELSQLGVRAAVILCTPQQIDLAHTINQLIGNNAVGIFAEATMHTPTDITDRAVSYVRTQRADCIVSAGGGSTIGLGKAISVRTMLPHICIPTTYAGSEMTPILGETENGRKVTRRDPAILPGTVLYDVNLTMTLPVSMTATSGVNAIAHAVEALYASNGNPVLDLMALEGIKALSNALPILMASPLNPDARYMAFYGSWLCGICLGNADMALHHKLCHTLGGSFKMPHAETHTIMLPHVLAYNAPNIPEAMAKLATAIPDSHGDAVQGLNNLLGKLQVKRALKDVGMKENDLEKAAEIAASSPYPNPTEVTRARIAACLRKAWAGEPASRDSFTEVTT